MTTLFEKCYEQLIILIHEDELDSRSLDKALGFAMEIVEFSEAPSSVKKTLVVDLLKELASKSSQPDLCLSIIESEYFVNSIDLVVRASKGKLNVNKLLKKKDLFGCLCR